MHFRRTVWIEGGIVSCKTDAYKDADFMSNR